MHDSECKTPPNHPFIAKAFHFLRNRHSARTEQAFRKKTTVVAKRAYCQAILFFIHFSLHFCFIPFIQRLVPLDGNS